MMADLLSPVLAFSAPAFCTKKTSSVSFDLRCRSDQVQAEGYLVSGLLTIQLLHGIAGLSRSEQFASGLDYHQECAGTRRRRYEMVVL